MTRLQYCLNASTIRPTPLLEKIRVAAETGYAAIELWHDEIEEYVAAGGTLGDLKKHVADAGLAIPTTIYLADWFDADAERYPQILDVCKRRMQDAATLGAKYVIASPPAGDADYALGAARYRELLEAGESIGVQPSMEFLGFVGQLNTIEDAVDVMQRSGRSDATTILDPFHVFRGGGTVESISNLNADQIAISHFNDIPAEPPREQQHDPDRVMPGDGTFDLRRYLELLLATGYEGFLSLELFREDLWKKDPVDVAREGLDKMRRVVEG